MDALRRDHVGVYGHALPTTPFTDEMAARGVVFSDALSQAPQTLNSTASLFTSRRFPFLLWGVEHDLIPGVDPKRAQQWARTPRLAAANLTIAEVLQRGGYRTVALFNNPHHHATSGFAQGFDESRLMKRDPDQAYARVDSMVDAFLEWRQSTDETRPYYAYLHLMEPHNPYRPPEPYRKLFPPGEGRHLYTNGRPDSSFTEDDLRHMTALYDGEIRFFDDGLRSLVGALGDLSDLGNTLIVVTADHGEELLDHGGLGHGTTVELELLRIPLIFGGGFAERWAGRVVEEPVRNLDLGPTLVELAGLEIPSEFQGRSLVPAIENAEAPAEPVPPSYAWIAKLRSLTDAEWHCMRNLAVGRVTLYHRPSDPAGLTDVAGSNPDVVAHCIDELDRLERSKTAAEEKAKALKAVEAGGEPAPEDRETIEQLEALGYVEE